MHDEARQLEEHAPRSGTPRMMRSSTNSGTMPAVPSSVRTWGSAQFSFISRLFADGSLAPRNQEIAYGPVQAKNINDQRRKEARTPECEKSEAPGKPRMGTTLTSGGHEPRRA